MAVAELMERMGVIRQMVEHRKGLGRTAVMKLLYLLQAVRGVPLGYRFELYLYGPYASDVLDDIASAEIWGLVREEVVDYGEYGYGYQIYPCDGLDVLPKKAAEFAKKYESGIQWVVSQFGQFSAAELELIGTIVWVYLRAQEDGEAIFEEQLIQLALRLKPHFTEAKARQIVGYLKDAGVIVLNQSHD